MINRCIHTFTSEGDGENPSCNEAAGLLILSLFLLFYDGGGQTAADHQIFLLLRHQELSEFVKVQICFRLKVDIAYP